jgi:hypothetical protein
MFLTYFDMTYDVFHGPISATEWSPSHVRLHQPGRPKWALSTWQPLTWYAFGPNPEISAGASKTIQKGDPKVMYCTFAHTYTHRYIYIYRYIYIIYRYIDTYTSAYPYNYISIYISICLHIYTYHIYSVSKPCARRPGLLSSKWRRWEFIPRLWSYPLLV